MLFNSALCKRSLSKAVSSGSEESSYYRSFLATAISDVPAGNGRTFERYLSMSLMPANTAFASGFIPKRSSGFLLFLKYFIGRKSDMNMYSVNRGLTPAREKSLPISETVYLRLCNAASSTQLHSSSPAGTVITMMPSFRRTLTASLTEQGHPESARSRRRDPLYRNCWLQKEDRSRLPGQFENPARPLLSPHCSIRIR